jgi:hypothetical protein
LANWVRETLAARKRKHEEATYLAMRIAASLEGYAVSCHGFGQESDEAFRQFGVTPSARLPSAPSYPADADWKSLKPRMADDALTFLNEITLAQFDGEFSGTFEGNKFQIETELKQLGTRALEIATRMRSEYGLVRSLHFQAGPVGRMRAGFEKP